MVVLFMVLKDDNINQTMLVPMDLQNFLIILEDVTRSQYFFNFILFIFSLILYTMKYNLLL